MTREQENTNKKQFSVVLLAAGKGTRMKSPLPKVLHPVAGSPMILHLIGALKGLSPQEIRVVVGAGKGLVEKVLTPYRVQMFEQEEQRGTAHAVLSADVKSLSGTVVILNGDHPLISKEDLQKALKKFQDEEADFAVLTCQLKNPKSFGRIVRHNDQIRAIVEAKDASSETLKIREINTGAYIVKAEILKEFLPQVHPNNAQKEYYLTDLVSLCVENQIRVLGIPVSKRFAFGVNNQEELSQATNYMVRQKIKSLMEAGVIFIQPETSYVEPTVHIQPGSVIYPQNFLMGDTILGSFCVLEPNCFLQDAHIGDGAQIKFSSHIEKSSIGEKSHVGPFARIRPETEIGAEARIGNFVEMKKVKMGRGSKASHLTYLGDATIGEGVNIGCGTITCNYAVDKKKYQTVIEDGVFVGSDSQFVAPVKIGKNAIIGSGSTITKDVPEDALAVARGVQKNIEGYAKRKNK